ncbi:peptide/nickel transport system ATP-binding protein [Palleronia aestuarii]|uniref:Peptide/nickel transport system ATP-binding protein n=1 Tax=Palleronia aestuarii TaxID=568105 RepID=A0A2W7N617_9RHOB|nr:ATP-binding cassette domain-containing protein [Palleronia aestuarii]PZX13737.1 peptide/nickel transport system ATP-binding protein [Palleronia aestuarii]
MSLRVESLGLVLPRADRQPVRLLDGISFTLGRGEILGIAGRSGAGKSLVAAALAGILPAGARRAGRITVDGQAPRPRDIALAPQRLDALDPLAPIGRQLRRLARGRRDPGGFLDHVGLSRNVARLYPHMLSGGMARRALLATSLASGADWIVADEPTVGLDPDAADHVMSLLGRLAQDGRGFVVVSHDLTRLTRISDRVLILENGHPVEIAPADAFTGDGTALSTVFSRTLWRAQLPDTVC